MYKLNFDDAAERNARFLKREMMDGILFKAEVHENPYVSGSDIYLNRDKSWSDRECLAVCDKKWVLQNERFKAMIYKDIDDDTITEGYPTLHFGESFYPAMLGAKVRFVGSMVHTCSGAKPIIFNEADLSKLNGYESNEWTNIFIESARYFADNTNGDFWLKYLISIDALNLAVELLGTTDAYFMIYDDPDLLEKIMEFGVEFNYWFYLLQKEIYAENNRAALGDELYELYDKTWYSIDAYNCCSPDVYKNMGFDYQKRLIDKIGGGKLHTHGTGLMNILPYISKLNNLSIMQIGRDKQSGEDIMNLDNLMYIREITGDIPLSISVSPDEFKNGIKNQTLPGGIEYICYVKNTVEANRFADIAKNYKPPGNV